MRTSILLTLSILLLLSLGGNYFQLQSAKFEQRKRFLENESWDKEWHRYTNIWNKRLTIISQRDSVIQSLKNERAADSVRYGLKQKSLQRSIIALKARIAIPAPLQDSVIDLQDDLIASISAERDTVYLRDNVIFDSLQSSIDTLRTMFLEELNRNYKLDEKLFKERRKRWSVGPQVGWGVTGPNVGVGVTWAVWKF